MDKGKIKPKRHLEFASSTDNKSSKKIFLNVKSCDQLRLKSFDMRDAHGKFSKKFEFSLTSFEIYTVILQNVLSDQKFAKFLYFAWINIYKLPLRKNSARQTFVNTKILFVSILPIICSFQQEYLT